MAAAREEVEFELRRIAKDRFTPLSQNDLQHLASSFPLVPLTSNRDELSVTSKSGLKCLCFRVNNKPNGNGKP